MSRENERTIEVYNCFAEKYIKNTLLKYNEDILAAKRKEQHLQNFFLFGFSSLAKNASLFEIGSGSGDNSVFLSKEGFDVTASDIAPAFIQEIKKKHNKTIVFNVLTDSFQKKYNGILCWRVFVHFTVNDARIVLSKVFNALENGGRFIFNAMNIEGHRSTSEWLDFSGIYHLGEKRYYHYYDELELNDLIKKTGFRIVQTRYEGGSNNRKWLVYILEK